jgi:hypothetical protein
MGEGMQGLTDLVTASKQISIAIGLLNQTISNVFPQGQAVTNSAGAASGNYLTITATDGNTYKIQLLDVV